MPTLERVLESALYVDDLDRAARFYSEVLQLRRIARDERLCAMDVGGQTVLLLFRREASLNNPTPHDGSGPVHIAFAIPLADLPFWEERLAARNITIESRVAWPRGGSSIYFRDPDGHLLEFATPGVWETY